MTLIFRLNLLIIFVSMGFIAHSTPNFEAAQKSLGVSPGPIKTVAFTTLPLFTKVSRSTNWFLHYSIISNLDQWYHEYGKYCPIVKEFKSELLMARFMHTVDLWYSPRWCVHFWRKVLFIYFWLKDGRNAQTYGLLERIGGFLSFRQHFKRLIIQLYELGGCANRDLRCLPYVWGICIRMDTPFGFHFSFSLTVHILVLPRAIYLTTRLPRSYQILLAKFWCVYR